MDNRRRAEYEGRRPLRIQGSGSRAQGSGNVQGSGSRAQGSGFRVQGSVVQGPRNQGKKLSKAMVSPLVSPSPGIPVGIIFNIPPPCGSKRVPRERRTGQCKDGSALSEVIIAQPANSIIVTEV